MTPEERDRLGQLLGALDSTQPEEIDCDEVLERVGPYLEAHCAGAPLPPELEQVAQHLSVCPQCLEEFKALTKASEGD